MGRTKDGTKIRNKKLPNGWKFTALEGHLIYKDQLVVVRGQNEVTMLAANQQQTIQVKSETIREACRKMERKLEDQL